MIPLDLDAMEARVRSRTAARDSVIFYSAPTVAFDANGTVTIDDNVTMRRIPAEPDAADADVLALTAALRSERAAREADAAELADLRAMATRLSAANGRLIDEATVAKRERRTAEEQRDTARSALDGLVAAVRAEREARAAYSAADADRRNGVRTHDEYCAAWEAYDAARARLDALLSAAPAPTTVPAPLVRAYLAAVDWWEDGESAVALHEARTALDAALGRCP